MNSLKVSPWIIPFAASVLFVTLYAKCLFMPPAGDDWWLIHPVNDLIRTHGLPKAIIQIFLVPVFDFYRPFALLPMAIGWYSLPLLQAIRLGVLLLGMILIVRTGRRLGLSDTWSALVGAIVLLHQIAASVSTEIDLWGEIIAMISFVWLLERCISYSQGTLSTVKLVTATSVLSAVCMLSKEAGVGAFIIPLLFLVLRPHELNQRERHGLVLSCALALALTFCYFLVRSALGILSGGAENGYYSLHYGTNILQNLAFALVGLLSPVDTVRVVLDGWGWRMLAVVWTAGLSAVIGYGLWRQRHTADWRMTVLLLVAVIIVQGPVLLMTRLPEANLARSLPFGWLAVALVLSPLLNRQRRRTAKVLAASAVVMWFAINVSAVHSRSSDVVSGQLRAARYRTEIKRHMARLDSDTLRIAVIDPGYRGHAMYRQPLVLDMRCGEVPDAFREMYPGSVTEIKLAEVKDPSAAEAVAAQFLIYDDGSVTTLKPAD